MDKFKFAELISFLAMRFERTFGIAEMEIIDRMITEGMPKQEPAGVGINDLHLLLEFMHDGKKIDAIKMHRAVTGYALKESKDVIEKYWVYDPSVKE